MKTELILTFDATVVNSLMVEGMNKVTKEINSTLVDAVLIQPRYMAETSEITRHPIPYAVLYDEYEKKIFLYRRTKQVGESRLAGNASCGIGGHVDITCDTLATQVHGSKLNPISAIYEASEREIEEETGHDLSMWESETIGILRDDSNDVGKVHLGWIILKYVGMDNISVVENELETIGWVDLHSINVDDEELNLENWSKITIAHLQSINPRST